MRALLFALAACAAACSPAAAPDAPPTPEVQSPEALRDEVLAVLTAPVSQSIGQPVSFEVTTLNVRNEWAWLVAQPRDANGTPLDWSTTNFASAHEHGALDGSGTTYALLKREDGQWRLLEHAIGPTDVAYVDWPIRHGAPADLMGLPPG